MTTTTAAQNLTTGDTFTTAGSTRTYTVTEVTEAHRSEYAAVVTALSSTGKTATIAFPAGATVTLHN